MWHQPMHEDLGRGEHSWFQDSLTHPFDETRYHSLLPYHVRYFSIHHIQVCALRHYGPPTRNAPSLLYLARRKVSEMSCFSEEATKDLSIVALGYERDFHWLRRGVAYADEKEKQRATALANLQEGEENEGENKTERTLSPTYAQQWKQDWSDFDSMYFPNPFKQIDALLKRSEVESLPPVFHLDKLSLFYVLYSMQIQNLACFRLHPEEFSSPAEYEVYLQEKNTRGNRCWGGKVCLITSLQPCRQVGKRASGKRRTAEAFFHIGIRSPFVPSQEQLKALIVFAWERTEAGHRAHKATASKGFYYGLQRTFLLATVDLCYGKKERFFTRRTYNFSPPIPHPRSLTELFLRKDYLGGQALARFRECAQRLYEKTLDPSETMATNELPFTDMKDLRIAMNRAYVVFHEPLRDFLLLRFPKRPPLPPPPPPTAAAPPSHSNNGKQEEDLLPAVFPVRD